MLYAAGALSIERRLTSLRSSWKGFWKTAIGVPLALDVAIAIAFTWTGPVSGVIFSITVSPNVRHIEPDGDR